MSITDPDAPKTAFVFAGGGSFGAVQVGMLQALAAHGVAADMVVGSSVGALNGAFYAGDPTVSGVARPEPAGRVSGELADAGGLPVAARLPDPA
ncbi:patatin-like phospholipase family protein [Bradyrhizobium sp. ma5]|uniref:patatin-like phospholipase family protein n=1 Tax=Bradyrhizobium sp. ma5 TaxID=3344828 RepID=UPI0035D4EB93